MVWYAMVHDVKPQNNSSRNTSVTKIVLDMISLDEAWILSYGVQSYVSSAQVCATQSTNIDIDTIDTSNKTMSETEKQTQTLQSLINSSHIASISSVRINGLKESGRGVTMCPSL